MYMVLEHLANPIKILNTLKNGLKKGGHLIIEVPYSPYKEYESLDEFELCKVFENVHLFHFSRKNVEYLKKKLAMTLDDFKVIQKMEFIKNCMTANSKRATKIQIDFVWSTQKGMSSLFPLYEMAVSRNWNSKFYKVKKQGFLNRNLVESLSNTIIIAYDQPLYRLWKSGWSGKYIYIEHGLGAIKYYTYKYNFFHKAELLFYPGPVFQRKMDAINPAFKNGLLGGYPKMDDLINNKINRENMYQN